ncbi:FHA domain-containing protein [Actinoplanes sp. NPDC051513]|uniref:FHA domain-containing protein n=1 Tax=Actinoplanes sp. NPDC051513 TaxID=3363908 RepID=UPI00379A92B6
MTARACVECGVTPRGDEESCRICGGLVPPVAGRDAPDASGGETVALPPVLLGPRADDAAGASGGSSAGDLLRVVLEPEAYTIEVRRGEQVVLGRALDISPHAGYLRRFDDVSRRHATLRVDAEGHAFVRDEYSTNWTVRNGARIVPGDERPLHGGDRLRFGSSVGGVVRLVTIAAGLPGTPRAGTRTG